MEELAEILNDLLEENDIEKHPYLAMHPLTLPNYSKTASGQKYEQKFKDFFKLTDDDIIYQNHGGVANLTDMDQFIGYSVVLAGNKGPREALSLVKEYLDADKVEGHQMLLLQTVDIDREYQFGNEVKLITTKSIPNKAISQALRDRNPFSLIPEPTIESVLILKGSLSKFIGKKGDRHGFDKETIPLEPIFDVLFCLSLVRNPDYGIQPYYSRIFFDEEKPFWWPLHHWRTHPYVKPNPFGVPITKSECDEAEKLLKSYEGLPKNWKKKMRVAMDKLNNYGTGLPNVERAINLRICLEAIFLNDGNKEQLRYRLALRGALFLEASFEERKRIFKILRGAYDLSSKAVHSGDLDEHTIYSVLEEGAKLAQQAIRKVIAGGAGIDWTAIELGQDDTPWD